MFRKFDEIVYTYGDKVYAFPRDEVVTGVLLGIRVE
jgi:hypothetical protein